MLNTLLKRVTVVGAAGKMGRGIALLLLEEMARLEATTTGHVGEGDFRLVLIDSDALALEDVKRYLKPHIVKWAERNINTLREAYASNEQLIDNADIIFAYVEGAMNVIQLSTDLSSARGSLLIFEAIVESLAAKAQVIKELETYCSARSVAYFSNTSSLPIQLMAKQAGISGKLLGFHFYNPPAVQRLVEIIPGNASSRVREIAVELGDCLGKTLVYSSDTAGFIGNGHFVREVMSACEIVAQLTPHHGQQTALVIVDTVTRDFLIRPMGIFQLLDYIGWDVAQLIGNSMITYIPGLTLDLTLINTVVAAQIRGGQKADGSQRDGIFQYSHGRPTDVFNLNQRQYMKLPDLQPILGSVADGQPQWKALLKDPARATKIQQYLNKMFTSSSFGAKLAQQFALKSRVAAKELVQTGVASCEEDINVVLQNGFGHLYGPINSYY